MTPASPIQEAPEGVPGCALGPGERRVAPGNGRRENGWSDSFVSGVPSCHFHTSVLKINEVSEGHNN